MSAPSMPCALRKAARHARCFVRGWVLPNSRLKRPQLVAGGRLLLYMGPVGTQWFSLGSSVLSKELAFTIAIKYV